MGQYDRVHSKACSCEVGASSGTVVEHIVKSSVVAPPKTSSRYILSSTKEMELVGPISKYKSGGTGNGASVSDVKCESRVRRCPGNSPSFANRRRCCRSSPEAPMMLRVTLGTVSLASPVKTNSYYWRASFAAFTGTLTT